MSSDEEFRSFAVEAWIGRRASGWPFARFDVGPQALQVRLPFPWSTSRTAAKQDVRTVSVGTGKVNRRACLRFDTPAGSLTDVRVYLPLHADRIVDELRRCGYDVADKRVTVRRLVAAVVRRAKR